jgi:hypothetical protein
MGERSHPHLPLVAREAVSAAGMRQGGARVQ